MDKTLFELTPVSVPPDVAGEYSVCYSDNGIADTSSLWEPERGWYNDRYTDTPITHYLRPLPPPVAEERTFTLAEMRKCWKSGRTYGRREVGEHYGGSENETPDFDEYIKLITLPE